MGKQAEKLQKIDLDQLAVTIRLIEFDRFQRSMDMFAVNTLRKSQ